MQIKEFEALSLKECLQRVRDDMGPEAVILETRKFRKGGLMGLGAKEAVCIVAATGITVQNDLPTEAKRAAVAKRPQATAVAEKRGFMEDFTPDETPSAPVTQAASGAARAVYARAAHAASATISRSAAEPPAAAPELSARPRREAAVLSDSLSASPAAKRPALTVEPETARFAGLERAMQEIREGLMALKDQQAAHERAVTAVVSAAVTPRAIANENESQSEAQAQCRFPELQERLLASGVSSALSEELLDSLPDFDAWSSPAQRPLAEAALRDLISRRFPCAGPIQLTPGKLKAIALIGPTGVGKTTTIAKLAAHFSLVEGKKVALLTVDTYRIAAVEQLKTYSQIIDIPIAVAYSQAEVLPAVAEFADYDLLLIDTAGRSQKNIMQVGELKALLESLNCETHLALAAPVKEADMVEAARRFSAACVDRVLFTKLDETGTYGTLLNVTERTGIPISYLTSGQKVPEDIEMADGRRLAELILGQ